MDAELLVVCGAVDDVVAERVVADERVVCPVVDVEALPVDAVVRVDDEERAFTPSERVEDVEREP